MSGKRRKVLRKQAARALGHDPKGIVVVGEKDDLVAYIPSEWRRVKQLFKKGKRNGIR